MTQEWVRKQSIKFESAQQLAAQKIIDIWNNLPEGYHTVFSTKVELFVRIIRLSLMCGEPIEFYDIVRLKSELEKTHHTAYVRLDMDKEIYEQNGMDKEQFDRFWLRLLAAASACEYYMRHENPYTMLENSRNMHMTGDIIIAKPSDILPNTDITECLQIINNNNGIAKVLSEGKWGFGGYDLSNHVDISSFITKAGQVCVAKLEDILKINPSYNDHMAKPYACTYIKNFDGSVKIEIKESGCSSDAYKIPFFVCCVKGQGVDMESNRPISFSIEM